MSERAIKEDLICLEELGVAKEVAAILKKVGIANLGSLKKQSPQSLAEQGLVPEQIDQVSRTLGQMNYRLEG